MRPPIWLILHVETGPYGTIAPAGAAPGQARRTGGVMEDVRELLAEYGQVHSDELPEADRHRLLVDVVAALIRRTDPDATLVYRSPYEAGRVLRARRTRLRDHGDDRSG